MSRVLITGGAGAIGAAVARRLLGDPAYDVRISDRRTAPLWMREGCEVRDGDLRAPAQALAATKGCALIVHLAAYAPEDGRADAAPYALIEYENAVHAAVVRAAVERRVERIVYVSTAEVLERAERAPTPESDLPSCPPPRSARAFARLVGERYCTSAHEQHDLLYAICRPSAVYGAAASASVGEPGMEPLVGELVEAALRGERTFELDRPTERTCTPTHIEDVADGIVLALGSEAALNEDFNFAGPREVTLGELARIAWEAAGAGAPALMPKSGERTDATPERGWPSSEKARELLGWQPRIAVEQGIAATMRELDAHASAASAAASASG